MKKTMDEYFDESRRTRHRERNSQNDAGLASFDESFKRSLKYVEKHKESIAYDMACDWEEHKFRCQPDKTEQKLETLGGSDMGSVANTMDRKQRTARLIELGKSYCPAAERCVQQPEPNKSAQQSPDLSDKMLKSGWGYLFEVYGDKPFTVRPSEPLKNLMPDDPDRSYRNRKDFDIDRE